MVLRDESVTSLTDDSQVVVHDQAEITEQPARPLKRKQEPEGSTVEGESEEPATQRSRVKLELDEDTESEHRRPDSNGRLSTTAQSPINMTADNRSISGPSSHSSTSISQSSSDASRIRLDWLRINAPTIVRIQPPLTHTSSSPATSAQRM